MSIGAKKPKQRAYPPVWSAGSALDAVEHWAAGCLLLRETGMFRNGRLDGLLVTTHYETVMKRAGFYGVEVKVSRSDFLKGLQTGQFDRYAAECNGLYIATTYGVCKTSEIPREYGHLVVARRDAGDFEGLYVCVCKRHAKYIERSSCWTEEVFWRWVIDIGDQFHKRERKQWERVEKTIERIKSEASSKVIGYLNSLRH